MRLTIGVCLGIIQGFTWGYIWFKATNDENMRDVRHTIADKYKSLEHSSQNDELSQAIEMTKTVRILCWVMTSPKNHKSRAVHVRDTWGKRCNILLFVSTDVDAELPALKLDLDHDARDNLWGKTKLAFKYVYENYRNHADWFLKADDDTYVVVENLRNMLHSYKPSTPIYFGWKLDHLVKQGYMSGGAGYVLSREALDRFINVALKGKSGKGKCNIGGNAGPEDAELGHCLESVDVEAGDSRDKEGNERFFPLNPKNQIMPKTIPSWYREFIYYKSEKNCSECISKNAISFHYVSPAMMHVLEFFIYDFKSYGENSKAYFTGKLINATNPYSIRNDVPTNHAGDEATSSSTSGLIKEHGPILAIDGSISDTNKGFFYNITDLGQIHSTSPYIFLSPTLLAYRNQVPF